jgi:hypothetical protein
MTLRLPLAVVTLALLLSVAMPGTASAQSGAAPADAQLAAQSPAPAIRSKLWIVGGGGFTMARAGCATCDRDGVFTNSRGLFFDIGGRVSSRVDFGVELMLVSARLEAVDADPVLTTFILGIAQFRPRLDSGLYLRAGMGVGFAGKGMASPFFKLTPPYSTNALGVTYGIGWVFMRDRPWGVHANFQHHIAALGELTTESGTIKNVVGNYWTSGMAIVFRGTKR